MRRLAWLLCLLPGISDAAIAFVQANAQHNVGLTMASTTFAGSVTTGDVIGIAIQTQAIASAAPTSVVDSLSDSQIVAVPWTNPASGEGSMGIYLFVVGAGCSSGCTSVSITPTFASSTTWSAIVFEYSGVNTTTPLDGSASAVNKGATSAFTAASLTPTQSGDQEISFIGFASAVTISTWANSIPTSLTIEKQQNTGIPQAALGDTLLAGTTAVSITGSLSAGASWNAVQFLLAPGGGGGASCTHAGWNTASGAFSVPTAGAGAFWLQSGAKGSTDCSATKYWQSGGVFGAN